MTFFCLKIIKNTKYCHALLMALSEKANQKS